jgi:hypothetical protein
MDTELFNEKTIKRLCSNVNVSPKQKKNANEWIKLLESGSLEKERTNYFRFAIYILKDILGYSIREDLDYEKANIEFTFKDSIGKTILCIEAKGGTQDLFSKQGRTKKEQSTPFKQTWDNMGRIDTIKYGICTNYRDFILIDKSKGYSKSRFFAFVGIKEGPEKLKEFIAIFSKESIIDKEFIEKLYEKSIIEEREFTKEFYKLFHETRLMLIKEFQDNGATKDESIHYTQIFLNRLMFVFFAEDTGKLQQRLFEEKVLNLLKVDSIFSENTKLACNLIKSIFQNLNEGSKRHNIFGFNGGLFKEEIPDKVYFKDFRKKSYFDEIYQNTNIKKEIELDNKSKEILNKFNGYINPTIINLLYLASFDFNTEVSVNILGHIFEQSISDLEELQEEKALRRKKEGVYYTPDIITDYICRNTIIPYLSKEGNNTVDKLIDEYSDNIEELEDKCRNLKILDPACGSGSFLLKAVEILLEIHKEVQIHKQDIGEYTAKKKTSMKRWQKRGVKGDSQLTLIKWNEEDEAREIIENNIYGVDINEESVEITKLSLFFKIVKKNKKLIDLSNTIKCGNSLVDTDEIAKEKSFNWDEKFPFKFDIIIGNPPYVSNWQLSESDRDQVLYLSKKYSDVALGHWDLYVMFIYKSLSLLKKGGYHSFILPSSFSMEKYGKSIRGIIINNYEIRSLVDFGVETIFDDVARQYVVYVIKNDYMKNNNVKIYKFNKENLNFQYSHKINQDSFLDFYNFTFRTDLDNEDIKLKEKIEENSERIGNICCINVGVVSHSKKDSPISFKKDDVIHDKYEKGYKLYVEGEDISRYSINWKNLYMDYESKSDYFHRPKFRFLFENPKIMVRRISGENNAIIAVYDEEKYYTNDNVIHMCLWDENIINYQKPKKPWTTSPDSKEYSLKYILAILNSKLMTYYFSKFISTGTLQGTYSGIYPEDLRSFPIKKDFESFKLKIEDNINKIIKQFSDLNSKKAKLINRFKGEFDINKVSNKINEFYNLTNIEFLKEIEKISKNKLSFSDKDKWEDYFNEYKKELLSLQNQIKDTDKDINSLIYELYGLKKKEIEIIEKSLGN